MTEKSIYFPIVFHFHQPVGNFEHVFEDCYKKSYKPLIGQLYNFPEVKATLHFSGNLLEWFITNKPTFIKKLKEMINREQIELIGGGYYEPIYAIIPDRDKLAQMRKLSDLIFQEFGLEVKGAWLSERVWEPDYPSFLDEAGLKYVIVDDNHFRATGITEDQTLYSYNTENNGKTVRVFPINEPIRYYIPWKPTNRTIDYLKDNPLNRGELIEITYDVMEKLFQSDIAGYYSSFANNLYQIDFEKCDILTVPGEDAGEIIESPVFRLDHEAKKQLYSDNGYSGKVNSLMQAYKNSRWLYHICRWLEDPKRDENEKEILRHHFFVHLDAAREWVEECIIEGNEDIAYLSQYLDGMKKMVEESKTLERA